MSQELYSDLREIAHAEAHAEAHRRADERLEAARAAADGGCRLAAREALHRYLVAWRDAVNKGVRMLRNWEAH